MRTGNSVPFQRCGFFLFHSHIVDLDRSRASCIVSLGRRWHNLCGHVFVYCPLQLTDFFLPVFTQVIRVRRLFLLLGYRPLIPSSKCFGYWLDMHLTYCWLIVVSAAAAFRFCLALLVAAVLRASPMDSRSSRCFVHCQSSESVCLQ